MKALGIGIIGLWLVALAACGQGNSALVEQREVTAGEFNGLVIGMDRNRTLEVVKALGAQVIGATPCRPFRVTTDSSNSLPSFADLEGIRVTDSVSHFEDIHFVSGKVSRITHTPGVDLLAGTAVGEGLDVVQKRLRSTSGLAVTPIVDMQNGGVVVFSVSDTLPPSPLSAHNCWRFEINSVAPAGAVYEIEFGPAGLNHISYRRPRVRVE